VGLRLTDSQHAVVNQAARQLSPDKRAVFFMRVAGHLRQFGPRASDHDLDGAIRVALTGLVQEPATASSPLEALLRP
jgi:hypothetical protein